MRIFTVAFTILIVIWGLGCDTTETSFDDSVPKLYTLKVNAVPEEGGKLEQTKEEFMDGSDVTIEAIPADGYLFDHWSGDLSGDDNPAKLTITKDMVVTATFQEVSSFLDIDVEGDGAVSTKIDHTTAELTAEPSESWTFSRWEGDLTSTLNPDTLVIDGYKRVTAFFEKLHTLDVQIEGEGSVDSSPTKDYYEDGENITLTAEAELGWEFSEWKGNLSGNENRTSITMDQDKTVIAVFERCIFCR